MPSHADLTGVDLHESKGVSTAAIDTVYVANGSGSGSWVKVDADNIDTSSIFTTNKFFLTGRLTDVSTASSVYIPIPVNCTLTKVYSTLQGAITTADSIITVANYAGTTAGTFTVAQSGSAAGDIDSVNISSNNTFLAGTYVKVSTDGGSTNTVVLELVLLFTQTS